MPLLEKIIEHLNMALIHRHKPGISPDQVVFAFGAEMEEYQKDFCKIPRNFLIQAENIETVLSPIFSLGPEWVRANLLPLGERESFLVELHIGPLHGKAVPDIIGTTDLRRKVILTSHSPFFPRDRA